MIGARPARYRRRLWLLAAAVVGGCAGEPIVPTSEPPMVRVDFGTIEARLKRNGTNQLQVHALLGSPHAVGITVEPSGARYEEWFYYVSAGSGAPSSLEIKFDRQGILRGYRWLDPRIR